MIILEDLDVSTFIVKTAEDCSYLYDCGGTATCAVSMTMKDRINASDEVTGVVLVFSDNGGSDDTITRDKGSWLENDFRVGMLLTIADTVSNNGTGIVITGVTDKVLSVATGSLADETTDVDAHTTSAVIPDTDWVPYEAITAAAKGHTVVEMSGTGLKFVKGGSGTVRIWVRS